MIHDCATDFSENARGNNIISSATFKAITNTIQTYRVTMVLIRYRLMRMKKKSSVRAATVRLKCISVRYHVISIRCFEFHRTLTTRTENARYHLYRRYLFVFLKQTIKSFMYMSELSRIPM